MFTFGLKGGYDAGVKLVSNVKLFSHLANIGDTRSLIIHPASTTHRQLSDAQKVQAGAGPDVVRLSVGPGRQGRHHRRPRAGPEQRSDRLGFAERACHIVTNVGKRCRRGPDFGDRFVGDFTAFCTRSTTG